MERRLQLEGPKPGPCKAAAGPYRQDCAEDGGSDRELQIVVVEVDNALAAPVKVVDDEDGDPEGEVPVDPVEEKVLGFGV